MYWANFLHFYQPPTQKPYWIHKITAEAYRPILQGLKAHPQSKVTLNINGVLLELLDTYGEHDIIDLFRDLLASGQIELTGSAKYHPLLPFLPREEAIRQIQLNEATLIKYFGDAWKRKGFFPPEMGFTKEVGLLVRELGYQWIIVDELSCPANMRPIDYSKLYTLTGVDDFLIHFRERRMSWVILSGQVGTGNLLIESLGERFKNNEYLLTAMDGETFGHHRPGLEQLLFELYEYRGLTNILISDLPTYFTGRTTVDPESSTWALMEKDLHAHKPFARGRADDNNIQRTQWELTSLAIQAAKQADQHDPGYAEARGILDQALHSDQYWWASARPWWSIEMIERGAKDLTRSVNTMPGVSEETKTKARHLYQAIVYTAFDWQREGIVDQLSHQEDEDIRQRTDVSMPKLPKAEIDKMINQLDQEMQAVASRQEYERAAQIRNRIAELRRYASETAGTSFTDEGKKEWG